MRYQTRACASTPKRRAISHVTSATRSQCPAVAWSLDSMRCAQRRTTSMKPSSRRRRRRVGVAVGAAHAKLREGAIGAVEGDERLGVTVVAGQEVGALAGGLRDQEQVVEFLRLAVALLEQAFGAGVVPKFAGDDAIERQGAGGEGDVVEAPGEVEGAFGRGLRAFDVGTIERHLGARDLEDGEQVLVAPLGGRGGGVGEGLFGGVPALGVGVERGESRGGEGGERLVASRPVFADGDVGEGDGLRRVATQEGEVGEVGRA